MIKRVLLLSSLMLSVPAWAADQSAAGTTPAARAATPAAGQTGTAKTVASAPVATSRTLEETEGGNVLSRDPKPDTGNAEHDALLSERRQQQRLVLHLRAKRDSELNRLALARLAASRGGDPDFNEKKNQAILDQMRGLQADYDQQVAKAQADLDAIDARLAKFSGN